MSLQLVGIGKRVGTAWHLQDIDLELPAGSFNVLLGLTLAGKTSLMRLMAGLDHPNEGRILMNGRDVTGVPVRKRNVAMVYQQFINYPSMTVYDNIASPLRMAGLERKEIDRRVRAEAERLHLSELLDRLPSELSGGQQQRTAMARALVRDAELLLLDEPLVNLDYKLREELRAEMRDIFARRRAVVVYATTDPAEALSLGGHTAVLQEGRLVQYGPTLTVFNRPATEHVAYVFSDPPINMSLGEIKGAKAIVAGVEFARPPQLQGLPDGRYRFGVRARHLGLRRSSPREIERRACVTVAEITGSETFIHLDCDGNRWVVQAGGVHDVRIGSTLSIYLDPERLFAFDLAGRLAAAPDPLTRAAET